MSDVERLTLQLLDGTISERELAELERLLAESDHARAVHVALCDQEAALRGDTMPLDVSRDAMERVRRSPAAHAAPSRQADSSADVAALTLKLLDGEIEEGAFDALEARLADGEQARALHVALCDQEAALRSVRRGFDVRGHVMRRLQAETKPHGQPATTRSRRGRRHTTPRRAVRSAPGRRPSWGIMAPLALAAVLLLAAGVTFVLWKPSGPHTTARVEVPAAAKVVRAGPGVTLTRSGTRTPLATGMDLVPGDGIAVPADSTAAIGYGDGTRLTLHGDTSLTMQPPRRRGSPVSGKRVILARGVLTADVARQAPSDPLVCLTPTVHATVLGTRFVLSAAEARTRLEVVEGAVRLTRDHDRAAVVVTGGHYADVTADADLVALPIPQRERAGLVALYRFGERRGRTVRDVSGAGEGLDLRIRDAGAVRWLTSGGLVVQGPTIISSERPALKITHACQQTRELTIEAWIAPAKTGQSGPARIVELSEESHKLNFLLGQESRHDGGDFFVARLRTSQSTTDGIPKHDLPPVAVPLHPTHVVCTRSADGRIRVFIDGVARGEGEGGGDFSPWDPAFRLSLANEVLAERAWLGSYYLVAIYSRALTAKQIHQNFRAGPHPLR